MKNKIGFIMSMFKIGCIGFGGGSALIPVIEEEFFGEGKLDKKKNLNRDVVVANLTPGALPVEIAGEIGRRNWGRVGMVIGAISMAAPGAFLTLLIVGGLANAKEQILRVIELAAVGVSSFVIYMLIQYIHESVNTISEKKERYINFLILFLVALSVCGKNVRKLFGISGNALLGFSTIHVLIGAYFIAAFMAFVTKRSKTREDKKLGLDSIDKKGLIKDLLCWLAFILIGLLPLLLWGGDLRQGLHYVENSILSVFMSFGGGDAYITVADGIFVDGGMISEETFFGEIVSVVNILPGSILCKTLVAIGYFCGSNLKHMPFQGIVWAMAGFVISVAMSCISFTIAAHGYDCLRKSRTFSIFRKWIRPIISGLLINVILALLNHNRVLFLEDPKKMYCSMLCVIGLVLLDFCLARKWNVKKQYFILINMIFTFMI